jgi:leucine-zipper of insertion element IS481
MAHANARLTHFGRLLLVQRITELGWPPAQAAESRHRQGPHRLAWRLGMPRSTIYGVLARHHMSRLAHTDRASGVVIRYQHQHPASWSTSTSRSWAASPTVVATAPTAAPRPAGAGGSATTTSTRRSTIAPGSPSANSSPARTR